MSQASLTRGELVDFLNVLLESERAGARTLADWLGELDQCAAIHAPLQAVQRDEARNCALLSELVVAEGAKPSMATGKFHCQARGLRGWAVRLRFLNRGQGWVARHIAEALPRVRDESVKQILAAMGDSHRVNIGRCDALIASCAAVDKWSGA